MSEDDGDPLLSSAASVADVIEASGKSEGKKHVKSGGKKKEEKPSSDPNLSLGKASTHSHRGGGGGKKTKPSKRSGSGSGAGGTGSGSGAKKSSSSNNDTSNNISSSKPKRKTKSSTNEKRKGKKSDGLSSSSHHGSRPTKQPQAQAQSQRDENDDAADDTDPPDLAPVSGDLKSSLSAPLSPTPSVSSFTTDGSGDSQKQQQPAATQKDTEHAKNSIDRKPKAPRRLKSNKNHTSKDAGTGAEGEEAIHDAPAQPPPPPPPPTGSYPNSPMLPPPPPPEANTVGTPTTINAVRRVKRRWVATTPGGTNINSATPPTSRDANKSRGNHDNRSDDDDEEEWQEALKGGSGNGGPNNKQSGGRRRDNSGRSKGIDASKLTAETRLPMPASPGNLSRKGRKKRQEKQQSASASKSHDGDAGGRRRPRRTNNNSKKAKQPNTSTNPGTSSSDDDGYEYVQRSTPATGTTEQEAPHTRKGVAHHKRPSKSQKDADDEDADLNDVHDAGEADNDGVEYADHPIIAKIPAVVSWHSKKSITTDDEESLGSFNSSLTPSVGSNESLNEEFEMMENSHTMMQSGELDDDIIDDIVDDVGDAKNHKNNHGMKEKKRKKKAKKATDHDQPVQGSKSLAEEKEGGKNNQSKHGSKAGENAAAGEKDDDGTLVDPPSRASYRFRSNSPRPGRRHSTEGVEKERAKRFGSPRMPRRSVHELDVDVEAVVAHGDRLKPSPLGTGDDRKRSNEEEDDDDDDNESFGSEIISVATSIDSGGGGGGGHASRQQLKELDLGMSVHSTNPYLGGISTHSRNPYFNALDSPPLPSKVHVGMSGANSITNSYHSRSGTPPPFRDDSASIGNSPRPDSPRPSAEGKKKRRVNSMQEKKSPSAIVPPEILTVSGRRSVGRSISADQLLAMSNHSATAGSRHGNGEAIIDASLITSPIGSPTTAQETPKDALSESVRSSRSFNALSTLKKKKKREKKAAASSSKHAKSSTPTQTSTTKSRHRDKKNEASTSKKSKAEPVPNKKVDDKKGIRDDVDDDDDDDIDEFFGDSDDGDENNNEEEASVADISAAGDALKNRIASRWTQIAEQRQPASAGAASVLGHNSNNTDGDASVVSAATETSRSQRGRSRTRRPIRDRSRTPTRIPRSERTTTEVVEPTENANPGAGASTPNTKAKRTVKKKSTQSNNNDDDEPANTAATKSGKESKSGSGKKKQKQQSAESASGTDDDEADIAASGTIGDSNPDVSLTTSPKEKKKKSTRGRAATLSPKEKKKKKSSEDNKKKTGLLQIPDLMSGMDDSASVQSTSSKQSTRSLKSTSSKGSVKSTTSTGSTGKKKNQYHDEAGGAGVGEMSTTATTTTKNVSTKKPRQPRSLADPEKLAPWQILEQKQKHRVTPYSSMLDDKVGIGGGGGGGGKNIKHDGNEDDDDDENHRSLLMLPHAIQVNNTVPSASTLSALGTEARPGSGSGRDTGDILPLPAGLGGKISATTAKKKPPTLSLGAKKKYTNHYSNSTTSSRRAAATSNPRGTQTADGKYIGVEQRKQMKAEREKTKNSIFNALGKFGGLDNDDDDDDMDDEDFNESFPEFTQSTHSRHRTSPSMGTLLGHRGGGGRTTTATTSNNNTKNSSSILDVSDHSLRSIQSFM